jgi:lipopolysaccharide export system permease protein
LEIALPMACLLGIMTAFGRLSGDSEIVVMRASGISLAQLIKPVLLIGLFAYAASSYISYSLRPWGYRILSRTLFEIARSKSTAGLDAGVFNRLGAITLYAEAIDDATGALSNVLIDDKRNEERRQIIIAKEGEIISDSARQTISINLADGVIHEIVDRSYALTNFRINNISLDPDQLYDPEAKLEDKRFREMTRSELAEERMRLEQLLIQAAQNPPEPAVEETPALPAVGGESPVSEDKTPEELEKLARQLRLEAGRRFSMPVAALLLALVAMPLGIQPPRAQKTWGVSISVLVGLFVFICYYGLLSIGIALVEKGALGPVAGLWLPNLAAACAALIFQYQVNSERWQSVAQGLAECIPRSLQKLRRAAP